MRRFTPLELKSPNYNALEMLVGLYFIVVARRRRGEEIRSPTVVPLQVNNRRSDLSFDPQFRPIWERSPSHPLKSVRQ